MGNIAYSPQAKTTLGAIAQSASVTCDECSRGKQLEIGYYVWGYIGSDKYFARENSTLNEKLNNLIFPENTQLTITRYQNDEEIKVCAAPYCFDIQGSCGDGKYTTFIPSSNQASSRFFHIPDGSGAIPSKIISASMGNENVNKIFRSSFSYSFSNIIVPKYDVDDGDRSDYDEDQPNPYSRQDSMGTVVLYYGSPSLGGPIMPTIHRARTRIEYNPNDPGDYNILGYNEYSIKTPGWRIGYLTKGDANQGIDQSILVDKTSYGANGKYVGNVYIGRTNFPSINIFRRSKNR